MNLAPNMLASISLILLPLLLPTPAHTASHKQVIMSSTHSDPASKVREELKKAEIIPTVVDDFTPSLLLSVSWSDSHHEASLGNTLKPDHLQDKPSISVKPVVVGESQTTTTNIVIVATDPDAPSRDDPKWSEFCHWIAVTKESSSQKALTGSLDDLLEDVMPYKPPGPPAKTGKHRYVFLALVPTNGTTDELDLSKPGERKHWGFGSAVKGVRDWAKDNGLVPVAANFIYAQNKKQ